MTPPSPPDQPPADHPDDTQSGGLPEYPSSPQGPSPSGSDDQSRPAQGSGTTTEPQGWGAPQYPAGPTEPPYTGPGPRATRAHAYAPEGPTDPQGRQLALWWKRAIALIIDGVIVYVASFVIEVGLGRGNRVAAVLIGLVIQFAYFTALNGSPRGQTVGKIAMQISLRDMDSGGPVGPLRALGRAIAAYILFILFVVPWIIDVLWILWDPQRQAWHDKAVRSLVTDAA